jgi:hypothetical protein
MGRVWELSRHKGSELLVLLAIADYAKDDGSGAWPSINTLVSKTRLSERSVQYCLKALEASGELQVERGTGPHGSNMYHVRLDRCAECGGQGCKLCTPEKFAPVQSTTRRGAKSAPLGVQPVAPKPLVKPLSKPSVKSTRAPAPVETSYPDEFEVTPELRARAQAKYPDLDIDDATEEWATSMQSNRKKYRYTNWEAAWANAMKRAAGGWGSMAAGGRNARSDRGRVYGSDRARNSGEREPDPEGFTIERYSNIAS